MTLLRGAANTSQELGMCVGKLAGATGMVLGLKEMSGVDIRNDIHRSVWGSRKCGIDPFDRFVGCCGCDAGLYD